MTLIQNKSKDDIRIVHVVSADFGSTFSGTTYVILYMLKFWDVQDIILKIYGSDVIRNIHDAYNLLNNKFVWQKSISLAGIKRYLWPVKIFWYLIKNRNHYDIIHLHHILNGGLLIPIFTKILKKTCVVNCVLMDADNPSALFNDRFGKLKTYLFTKFNGHIGVSMAIVDDFKKHHLKSVLLYLPYYVTFEKDEIKNKQYSKDALKKKYGLKSDDIVLLFVGSMRRRKGVHILIETFIKLRKRYPNTKLLFVGPKDIVENLRLDSAYINAMHQRISNANIEKHIVFTGLSNDRNELAEYYHLSDIFLFPSLAEGLPIVVLEAMYYKLPVVASFLKGSTEYQIQHGRNGFLVHNECVDDFYCYTAQLIESENLRNRMGHESQQYCIENFGFDAHCRKLASFYRELVL